MVGLEPDDGKLSRPVLRGLGGSNAPWLPGVNNSPVNYNDPKGHCIEDFCIGEAIIMGALISAGVNAGIQVVGNMRNKNETFGEAVSHIDLKQLAISTVAGAVGGGIGGAVIGAITPLTSSLVPAVGNLVEGVVGGFSANAAYGQTEALGKAAANQIVAHTSLAGDDISFRPNSKEFVSDAQKQGFGNMNKIIGDGLVGGVTGGVGSGLGTNIKILNEPDGLVISGKTSSEWVPAIKKIIDVGMEWVRQDNQESEQSVEERGY